MIAPAICALAGLLTGETAILGNGFTLRVERHVEEGASVRLYTATGEIVMPRAAVVSFEKEVESPVPVTVPLPQAAPAIAVALPPPTPRDLVRLAAESHGLPAPFVESVAKAESAFRTAAVSHKGAIGLMQLMPATAAGLGVNPHDPAQNAEGGVRMLRDLLVQYQNEPDQVRLALAAYNAGPGAVAKYNGVPPYRETRNYVEKILRDYRRKTEASN